MIKLKYLGSLFLPILLATACQEVETDLYQESRAMANFSSSLVQHSFSKTGNEIDTVDVPFSINGLAADHVRTINFEVVSDSTTAIEGEDYTIVSADVLPGEFTGSIKVRAQRPGPDEDDRRLYFRLADGEDFIRGVSTLSDADLILTNRLTPPERWNNEASGSWKARYFLGTYSTAYYQFIIDVTGYTEYPYPWAITGVNNGQTWDSGFRQSFLALLNIKLNEYNETHEDVLRHDDGYAAGQPVGIGLYYTPVE